MAYANLISPSQFQVDIPGVSSLTIPLPTRDPVIPFQVNLDQAEVTRVLQSIGVGDQNAASLLMPLVDTEMRRIAGHFFKRENPNHTLQPTALVHEAYLKLVDVKKVDWQDRNHFFAVGVKTMRRISAL